MPNTKRGRRRTSWRHFRIDRRQSLSLYNRRKMSTDNSARSDTARPKDQSCRHSIRRQHRQPDTKSICFPFHRRNQPSRPTIGNPNRQNTRRRSQGSLWMNWRRNRADKSAVRHPIRLVPPNRHSIRPRPSRSDQIHSMWPVVQPPSRSKSFPHRTLD